MPAKKKQQAGSDWGDFAKEMEGLQKKIRTDKEQGLSDTRVQQIKDFVGRGLFVTVTGPGQLVYRVEKGSIKEHPPKGAPRLVTAEQMESALHSAISQLRQRPADEVEDGRTATGRIAELETSLKEVELLKSLGTM
jgi:hypothetical protein